MEENMQHFQYITLYYFNKGKNTTEMQKKICAVYGKVAVTDGMCQKRFVKFRVGDFSLDDAAWLGRPVEVDSDQIQTFIQNDQCYTNVILRISKSIKLLVKMKNAVFILRKKTHALFGQPIISTRVKIFHLLSTPL